MSQPHQKHKHSDFSASGAERWMKCPGSVNLSKGLPDKESVYSKEGTRAHEVLEELLQSGGVCNSPMSEEMFFHAVHAANFIRKLHEEAFMAELKVETRVSLPHDVVPADAFGTFDAAIVEPWGTLHIIDFKYGMGYPISPIKNLQLMFYAIGVAAQHNWDFKNARLWIIQPRVRGYDGPTFWDVTMKDLYYQMCSFRLGVLRAQNQSESFSEGPHCHWCKAKKICPLKRKKKIEQTRLVFSNYIEEREKKYGKASEQ